LILCETFPHVGEALVAVEEAVATGLETWVSFTAGPEGNLLTPQEIERGAREAVKRGASAVLVNCMSAPRMLPYVERLSNAGVPFGAYANAGSPDDEIGWKSAPLGAERYADFAESWVNAGATLIGSCCGTGPKHIAELARRFRGE
jgi:S-methylmethionine-dependent homocysteine/selenocysteine methylase